MRQILHSKNSACNPCVSSDCDAIKDIAKNGGDGLLGIYTNSIHKGFSENGYNPMHARVERYKLQSVVKVIIPRSRTANCLRRRISKNRGVDVWKNHEHQTAHFSGLQVCGSVWTCPVCAAKISERRRVELLAAMDKHRAGGGGVYLLTLTAPHTRGDDLAVLLDQQAIALQKFWNARDTKKVSSEMGYVGQVRALEITHGRGRRVRNNGWHPHYHVLIFAAAGFDQHQLNDFRVRFYLSWSKACVRAGLGMPTYEHGLRLDDGQKASAYVSKWGLENEMTKGHIKKAGAAGETPFDLLRAVFADSGDKQAATLFREFATVFHGKRQLSWSRGLRDRLGVGGDLTDQELSEQVEDGAEFLGSLSIDQWKDVLSVDARGLVLVVAARGGWPDVVRLLAVIEGAADGVWFDPADLAPFS